MLTVDHLINLGHRRIAHIAGHEKYFSSEQRLTGYKQSLQQAAIAYDETLIHRGDWTVSSGYRCAQQIITDNKLPTAIAAAKTRSSTSWPSACSSPG
jgi:LacI family transcriptional regulator